MNIEDDISLLFQKFIDDKINEEELSRFYAYIELAEANPKIQQLLKDLWEYAGCTFDPDSDKLEESVDEILGNKNRSFEYLLRSVNDYKTEAAQETTKKSKVQELGSKKQGLWGWLRGLFVLVIIVAAGVWYYFNHQEPVTTAEVAYVEKVSEYGQKSIIPLPDGSSVKLNSGSKLVYPQLFEGNTREVILEGEAFFEVSEDPERPFMIRTGDLITTVLGTTFNIRFYPEEPQIKVAVASGKVRVEKAENKSTPQEDADDKAAAVLTTNLLASYNQANSQIKVESRESIADLIAWKEGVLKFSGTRFSEVVKTLEKWYGVKINVENERLGDCVIFGEFKNESLMRVMQTLQYAIDIDYQLTDQGLTVNGLGCENTPRN